MFFINSIKVNAVNSYGYTLKVCTEVLGQSFTEVLLDIFKIIRIVTPILLLVLIAKDLLSAVGQSKEDEMKKAIGLIVKRIIAAVLIFFIPTIVTLILNLIGWSSGTCGI